MEITNKVRQAIDDFRAKNKRNPNTIYIGGRTLRRLMEELGNPFISPFYLRPGIGRDTFMNLDVYMVDEDEHLKVTD